MTWYKGNRVKNLDQWTKGGEWYTAPKKQKRIGCVLGREKHTTWKEIGTRKDSICEGDPCVICRSKELITSMAVSARDMSLIRHWLLFNNVTWGKPVEDHLRPKKTGHKGWIRVTTAEATTSISNGPESKNSPLAGNRSLTSQQHEEHSGQGPILIHF